MTKNERNNSDVLYIIRFVSSNSIRQWQKYFSDIGFNFCLDQRNFSIFSKSCQNPKLFRDLDSPHWPDHEYVQFVSKMLNFIPIIQDVISSLCIILICSCIVKQWIICPKFKILLTNYTYSWSGQWEESKSVNNFGFWQLLKLIKKIVWSKQKLKLISENYFCHCRIELDETNRMMYKTSLFLSFFVMFLCKSSKNFMYSTLTTTVISLVKLDVWKFQRTNGMSRAFKRM